jgi:GNAT superfamily N-acetyltransferase
MSYHVREATLDDLDILIRHRIAMFTDMGVALDAPMLSAAFTTWLRELMPAGTYRAWLVEYIDDTSSPGYGDGELRASGSKAEIVAGGGATIIPWPPGPQYPGERLAFVYNVYTEPAHRRRGLARLVMTAIHDWCGDAGVAAIALNASRDGRQLYDSLGYVVAASPMMWRVKV